jgi:hypothetical protein
MVLEQGHSSIAARSVAAMGSKMGGKINGEIEENLFSAFNKF